MTRDQSHTLYLIDISSFIFRAFYGIRLLHNAQGEPTNAVYGVATMVGKLIDEKNPIHFFVVYDSKEPSFRQEIFSDYKANRSAPPDDLIPQFDRVAELIEKMGIPSIRRSGVEADDLIATLTIDWQKKSPQNEVVIVSSDKDLMQLVNDRVVLYDTMKEKEYGIAGVTEKLGVPPHQVRDYLALVGDTSDNIPGLPGVGPKTAAQWLKEYESIPGVIQAARDGKLPGKKADLVLSHLSHLELSQKLVTLAHDSEWSDHALERTVFSFQPSAALIDFLNEMNFKSLAQKWSAPRARVATAQGESIGASEKPSASPSERSDFETIDQESVFMEWLEKIEKAGEFTLDLETTSLNPRVAEIVGIALGLPGGSSGYVPVGHRGEGLTQLPRKWVLDRLKPLIQNPRIKKIGQNLKYDFSVLLNHQIDAQGIGADTLVAAYLIDPVGRHNLDTLAARYLDYKMLTFEEVCGKGKTAISFADVPIPLATRYSAEDAWAATMIWEKLQPELEAQHLLPVFAQIDLPLVRVLTRMEMAGISLDTEWLGTLKTRFQEEIDSIQAGIAKFTSGPVNLNSPKQLAELLFEELKLPIQSKTKTGYSTDASVLEALAPLHEVPRLLLEYREVSKLLSTYILPLPGQVDPTDGKVHGTFHQAGTATGRLSSSDPNLQNIPIRSERGHLIRRAFVASPGCELISADYSQIELRILAHMSDDAELVRSFQKDEDVHRRTASEIFHKDLESVTDRERSIAKAINFGLMYGKTAFGLAQELHIPRTEAKSIIDRYFQRYAGVKAFLSGQIEKARDTGEVFTLLGRRRKLPDIHSKNMMMRGNAERMAMNTPIQGTSADLIRLAMSELDTALEEGGFKSRIVLQVHDELVLDCPSSEVKAVQELTIRIMENALKLSVPLRVNSSVGKNWAEL